MTMKPGAARSWIITSAVVVAGIYAVLYWKGQEKTQPGDFAVSWGTVYFILALIGEASPAFGGSLAILIGVGDLLGHAPQLQKAVQQANPPATPPKTAAGAHTSPQAASKAPGGK